MVMRVTQQIIYGNVIRQNNAALSNLMETNLQQSTQKRINAPSDDPNGTVQVLDTRMDISQLTQYKRNITSADGWLKQTDSTLSSVSTLITTIKGYAEQGATGTFVDSNRQDIGSAVRQYFQQLVSMANTKYGDNSLFSGQMTDTASYTIGLGMTSNDTNFNDAVNTWPAMGYSADGKTDSTVLVQFTGTDTSTHQPAFQYSTDGGSTWQDGTYNATPPSADSQQLQMGGVSLTVSNNALNAVTACSDHNDTKGTWLWIRPAAYYLGNTNDVKVTALNNNVTASATGNFASNVKVQITANSGTNYTYSYSTDDGVTWATGNTSGTFSGTPPMATLNVPGGVMTLGDSSAAGDEFSIQQDKGNIPIGISPTDAVVVNGVGKDIFGGRYTTGVTDTSVPGGATVDVTQTALFSGSDSGNLLETVGKLVGYLETNNQQGCQEALDNLTASQNQILQVAASVGARENRVTAAGTMVDTLTDNSNTTLSNVEDADLSSLITTLAQQELAYQAVLKSSSTVMQLSLTDYI